ncbi:MAG TPA: tetratricopeptide repeat protein [Terriglobia bacterium]|nr:tetratricopeptide repeat protein [Terriglobia bacterium]
MSGCRVAAAFSSRPFARLRWAAFLIGALLLPAALFAQAAPLEDSVEARAAEALKLARSGATEAALEIYQDLAAREPDNMALIRDYAVVLSWAEKYREAIPFARRAQQLAPEQPDWALKDFSAIYLFGDALLDALGTLGELIRRGDATEQTLIRRALALRWMGRDDDAVEAYERALSLYPGSADGLAGLAYSLADSGNFSRALSELDRAPAASRNSAAAQRARIRILNWMGRHYEAQRMIAGLSPELRDDREILEDRVAAFRWGGNPTGAMRDARRLVTLYPTEANRRMSSELRAEYGQWTTSGFRFSRDVDGLTDRSLSQEATVHLTPSQAIRAGYQYRWYQFAGEERTLVRYDAGWNGAVGSRLYFYTTLSGVDYRAGSPDRKLIGDGSMEWALNDSLRLTAGGGKIAMDAYQSLPNQVTAPFAFVHLSIAPDPADRFQGRYGRYVFSDGVVRDRGDLEYSRTLVAESGVKLKAGWRSNLLWHDEQTADFFSPRSFQSHLAVAQGNGAVTHWLDYSGEVAVGWQLEQGASTLHPLQFSGSVLLHPGRYWRMTVSAGRSTSSVDRVTPGQYIYSRWTVGASMEFRLS